MSNSEPVLVLVEVCVTKHEAPSNPVTSSCKSDLKKIAKQKQTHTHKTASRSHSLRILFILLCCC